MSSIGATLLLGALLGSPLGPEVDAPPRFFDAETRELYSIETPGLRLPIPEGFDHLGAVTFDLGGTAQGERQIFARSANGRVEALIVLQFESKHPDTPGRYAFAIPPPGRRAGANYRYSLEPIELGSHGWIHNTWAFDHARSAREQPGWESDLTEKRVTESELELPSELMMSRFGRAVGEDARRELILFYMEPLAAHGRTLADFPEGGPPSDVYDRLSAEVTERSLVIFRALEEPVVP